MPTDLVGTALATCVLTIMGIVAKQLSLDIKGTKATVEKTMATSGIRRIARLTLHIEVPQDVSDNHREQLEQHNTQHQI